MSPYEKYEEYLPDPNDPLYLFDPDEWFEDEGAIYDDLGMEPIGGPTHLPPEPTLGETDPNANITTHGHIGPQAQRFNDRVYYAWLGTCHRGTSSPQIWMAQVDEDGENWQSRQITTGHAKSNLRFKISEEVGVMHFFWHQRNRDDGYRIRRNNWACYTGWCFVDPDKGIFGIQTIMPTQRSNFAGTRRLRSGGNNFHGTYGISEMDSFYGATMYVGSSGMGSEARGFIHQGQIVALHMPCASALQNWCLDGTGFHIGGDFLAGPRTPAWYRTRWPWWGVWHCNTPYEQPLFIYEDLTFWRNGLCFGALKTTNMDYKDFVSVSMCLEYAYYSWRSRPYYGGILNPHAIGPARIITARMCVFDFWERFNVTEIFDGVGRNPDAWHGMVGIKCLDQAIYCPVKSPIQCNRYSTDKVEHGSSIL